MKTLLAAIALIILPLSQAAYLKMVEIKTGDGFGDGMGIGGRIDVTIHANTSVCSIQNIDATGNNFQPGSVDVFEEHDIDPCDHFYIPNGQADYIYIVHNGIDAWNCEYVRLEYTDTTHSQCDDGTTYNFEEGNPVPCVYVP